MKLFAFRCLISGPQNLILRSQNQIQILQWKITSFLKTTLLQRELFHTIVYTITSSPLLTTKLVFMLTIILSNYQQFLSAFKWNNVFKINNNFRHLVCLGSEFRENGHIQVRDDRSSKDDHSSISSHDPVIMSQTGGTSKKRKEKEKEKDKRKSSTFKGFGSMFR